MFCTRCGTNIGDPAAFCFSCGAPTGATAGAAPVSLPTGLRPLRVGQRIDRAIKAYRSNFKSNVSAMLMLAVPLGLLEELIYWSTAPSVPIVQSSQYFGGSPVINTGELWTYLAGALAVLFISYLTSVWASATIIQIVGARMIGNEMSWRTALGRAGRRLGSLTWILLLVTVLLLGPIAIVIGLSVLLSTVSHGLAVAIGILGGIAGFVYVVWFGVSSTLTAPVVMLEDRRGLKAIRRSVQLVKNKWWSVLGTLFLAYLLTLVITIAVSIVFVIAARAANGSTAATLLVGFVERGFTLVLVAPFTACVLAVIMIDMKVRKEGFDLELLARELANPGSPSASTQTTFSGSSTQGAWRFAEGMPPTAPASPDTPPLESPPTLGDPGPPPSTSGT
jgi:hypothetical protein